MSGNHIFGFEVLHYSITKRFYDNPTNLIRIAGKAESILSFCLEANMHYKWCPIVAQDLNVCTNADLLKVGESIEFDY